MIRNSFMLMKQHKSIAKETETFNFFQKQTIEKIFNQSLNPTY